MAQSDSTFDGPCYDSRYDRDRLTGQIKRIFDLMKDGRWRTLKEIAAETEDPAPSVSAQLRHLRKERFGAHAVLKRRRGNPYHGVWEYRLVVNAQSKDLLSGEK